jgi:PPM family protein phosphatase
VKVEHAYFSRKGRKGVNQDHVLPPFNFDNGWWSAIADGMGGHKGGDTASETAIKTVTDAVRIQHVTDIETIFRSTQDQLRLVATNKPELSSMGTTLSLLHFKEYKAEVGHVGDSRIYHLRGDGIVDRTVDQTEVEQLVQQGVLSRTRAQRYPRRHVLLSVLSPERKYDLYRSVFEVKAGDRLILLTDGVSSKFLRREVRDLSRDRPTPQAFCDALMCEIENRAPDDDYSAICIDIG